MNEVGYTIRGISKKAEYNFQPSHMGLTWDYLVDKFSLNDKYWKEQYKKYLSTRTRNIEELDVFLDFGHKHINPLLNGILGRMDGTPTWFRLVDHIIIKNSPKD